MTTIHVPSQLKLLGRQVQDKVTGFAGVVTSVSFDLYGCVQLIVQPQVKPDDKADLKDARWFDIGRLSVTGDRVMDPPTFTFARAVETTTMHDDRPRHDKGPADKPTMPR